MPPRASRHDGVPLLPHPLFFTTLPYLRIVPAHTLTPSLARTLPTPCLQLFINNKWVDSSDGATFATLNPATGEPIARVSEAKAADVDLAVAAARAAFERGSPWRTMDASQRGTLRACARPPSLFPPFPPSPPSPPFPPLALAVYKLADAMERDKITLASLDSLDNGKPYADALAIDLHLAIKCFRYYAGWADKICGKTVPIDGNFLALTRCEALGVCAQIIPWNFPLLMAAWKLAPALCAGCTTVIKSAEQTPLSLLHLASLVAEVGFPPGVVNCLSGFGPTCGAPMVAHPGVDKVAFTGSGNVGRLIAREAAGTLKNVTLELGGKSPAIVFADADLEAAAATCAFGIFFNAGQVCCASSRVYVQEGVYDAFVAAVAARAKATTLGEGLSSGAAQGPQVDQDSLDKIERMVAGGVAAGARLVAGGARAPGPGFFYPPTVFADVGDACEIAREEIFGPVMSILKFKTLEEVLARANDSVYGLAAAVFTTNLNTSTAMALGLRAGTVWVNCYNVLEASVPFGGESMYLALPH